MGTTSYHGDKPAWIKEAFSDIANKYPRVKEVTWMLYNVKKGNDTWDWDMNTKEEKAAFADGMRIFNNASRTTAM